MNFARVLSNVLQRVKPLYATSTGPLAQQTRNTYILRRKYAPLLNKKEGGRLRRLRSKDFVYELAADTDVQKQKPIDIILTTYVSGVGNIGQRLSLPPLQAYNKFLLQGLAVYASPENVDKYKDIIEKAERELPTYSSPWVPRTLGVLSTHLLTVVVSKNNPWTVEKYHVRAAFRKVNIHVPDDAITLPKRPITGPDLEKQNKEFYVTVTINNREQVKVRCRLHHFTVKESDKIPYTEFWKETVPAIFPEDQAILDSMPKHRGLQNEETA